MASTDSKFLGEGLTYDDVLLVPNYSEVLPRDVQLHAPFSRNIQLKTPIVSAAMDTVTESKMAIAMARAGGIGVVHKNMSIAAQANEVRKVKRSESGMIQDPITLSKDATAGDALGIMREHKIGGIPVTDDAGKLVGIVTNRDLRFEKQGSRPIAELMTSENLIVTEDGSDLSKAEQILREHRIEKLPVVDGAGKLVGLITYRDIIKLSEFPNSCKDQYGRLRVAAAVGVTADTHERVAALVDAGVDAVIVDTAHGRRNAETAVLVLARIGEFAEFDDVPVGDEADELAVLVHHGQFFDAMLPKDLFCFAQIAAVLRHDQILRGHKLHNGTGGLLFKTQIAVCHDAHQTTIPIGHWNAADFVLAHDAQRVACRGIHGKRHGVLNHAAFRTLHFADFVGLRSDGHVLVNHPDAALASHGNGHLAFGHGVHGGTDNGCLQLDVPGERRVKLDVARQHFGIVGDEQDVVVRQSFAEKFVVSGGHGHALNRDGSQA